MAVPRSPHRVAIGYGSSPRRWKEWQSLGLSVYTQLFAFHSNAADHRMFARGWIELVQIVLFSTIPCNTPENICLGFGVLIVEILHCCIKSVVEKIVPVKILFYAVFNLLLSDLGSASKASYFLLFKDALAIFLSYEISCYISTSGISHLLSSLQPPEHPSTKQGLGYKAQKKNCAYRTQNSKPFIISYISHQS